MFSGFQSNAFQQAFQIIPAVSIVGGDSEPTLHSYDLYLEKERAKKIAAKQKEIIAARLEAQENILLKRQLEAATEKQNTRQMRAILRRESELKQELLDLLRALRELEEQNNQDDDLIILLLACPFLVVH